MSLDQLFDGWSVAVAPYALALLAAALLCGLLAAVGWRRRSKPGGIQFVAMMTAAAIWALLYALELTAPTLAGKVVWAKAEYLGIVALPLTWFLFARSHTGATRRLGRWLLVLISSHSGRHGRSGCHKRVPRPVVEQALAEHIRANFPC